MIHNERERMISQTAADHFEHSIAQLDAGTYPCPPDWDPVIARAHREGLQSLLEDIHRDIKEWDAAHET